MTVKPPIVTLNGDRKSVLLDQLREVYSSLTATRDTICNSMPHGRNYQTYENGNQICAEARAQNSVWIQKLEEIQDEVFIRFAQVDKQQKS